MNEPETKPCTKCCVPIPIGAARCPKCQSWQSIRAYLAGNPHSWLTLLIVPIALLPMYWMRADRGEDFAKYREQVKVLDSQLRIGDEGVLRQVVTVGRLRNDSSIKWTNVAIEVQYFDEDGKLVATKTEMDHALVLLPNSEHAFQVSSSADLAPRSYASHKVFVRDARDSRHWP
jgi:hypothetical protein